jgi:hypothetical protein
VRHIWEYYSWTFTYTPEWALGNTGISYYAQILIREYPILFQTLLLTIAGALAWNPKPTLYVTACFGVPLVLQSTLFSWKHDRYILHLIPLMFLLASAGTCSVASFIHRSLVDRARAMGVTVLAPLLATILLIGAFVFLIWPTPWFRSGIVLHRQTAGNFAGVYHHNWRAAGEFVAARATPSDVVIASAPALARYYGVSAPLYYLANDSTEMHLEAAVRDGQGRPVEYIAGAPMIMDFDMLVRLMTTHESGWIVAERFRFVGSRPLPQEMREFIASRARAVTVPNAPTMIVWRW